MKKAILTLAAVAATAAVASPAHAQQRGPEINYNLEAEVETLCGVYSFIGTEVSIDFGELANTSDTIQMGAALGYSQVYQCNSPAGFTRTITSLNDGDLVRVDSDGSALNRIPFQMTITGNTPTSFALQSIAGGKTDSIPASAAYLNGVTNGVEFAVQGVENDAGQGAQGTSVYAGDYVDVVTVAVVAN